jgi:predicted metal-binding membrane protein
LTWVRDVQTPPSHADRSHGRSLWTFAALLGIAAAAWAALLTKELADGAAMSGMGLEPKRAFDDPLAAMVFVGAWVVMMAAMMLPSTTPMVLLYRNMIVGSPPRRAAQLAVFVSAYLVTWALFGVAVYVAQESLAVVGGLSPDAHAAWPGVVSAVVLAAGVYQLSPLKDVCLRQCRSPFSFLMERWRPGIGGGLSLGFRHGLYCVGCCWALMAVLVAGGAMGLEWVALLAVVVFTEKILPAGRAVARLVGAFLVGLAVVIALRPDLVNRVQM